MKDRYSFTRDGLLRVEWAVLTPAVVWSGLRSQPRLPRHLPAGNLVVYGQATTGEFVMVGLRESVEVTTGTSPEPG